MVSFKASGKVLTRPVKSLKRDIEKGMLDPDECLRQGILELTDYVAENNDIFDNNQGRFASYETHFFDLVAYLSSTGFNVEPYLQEYDFLFEKIDKKIREEAFDPDVEKDLELSGRYKLRTREDSLNSVRGQLFRVKGMFRLLKNAYDGCRGNITDSQGNISDNKFKEFWEIFQCDLKNLRKNGIDTSRYKGTPYQLFEAIEKTKSRRGLEGFFIDKTGEIPSVNQLVG